MKPRFLSLARSTLVFSLVAMALVFTACLEEDDDFNNFRPVDFFIDADALSIDQGLPITFNDKSNNATSREWTFEGGTPATSTETNPTVIFADPGVYEIQVATTFNDGSVQRRTLFMEVFPTITADFSVNPVPQTPGNPVQLNNLTQGVGDIPGVRPEADSSILYQWVVEGFNDGDTISWVNNPVVSFDEIGTYDVTLRVLRRATGAIDIIRKTDAIEIIETPVFAAE
ncbi:MAG: PKD domain-containing protein, partial [Bacteroidota bacterium]